MRADGGAKMATIQQTFAFLPAEDAGKTVAQFTKDTKPKNRLDLLGALHLQSCNGKKNPPASQPQEQTADEPLSDSQKTSQPVGESPGEYREDRHAVLRRLRAQVGCLSTAATDRAENLSTACPAIDAMLPSGGLKRNAITEWVAKSDSSGAAALSLITAATYLRSLSAAGALLIVDLDKNFYPPAAVALGIPMDQIILVRPRQHAQMVWAIDQALRCEAVAAVWAHVGTRLDDRDARRFQLAAETGNTPGFFVRPKAVRGRPGFAEVRFHVASEMVAPPDDFRHRKATSAQIKHRLLQVSLDRCRGGVIGQNVWVQIDDQANIHQVSFSKTVPHETAAVHLASQLANPTTAQSTNRSKRRA